ncbi:hypothetical protein [Microbacterium testaceum]|uniref:hypothetical protein n=1 Tax=Microbacterium testaceum TaxID=2033 RepID=UPI000B089C2D|nr:hypothetical protein [Microbacterium testaceum]
MSGSDLIAIVGAFIALLGAGFAGWQAWIARQARQDAAESSREAATLAAESAAAWKSIAESQKQVALAHRPKAWSEVKIGPGDLRVVRNSSERPIRVQRIDATPGEAQALVRVEGDLPRTLKAGELLELYVSARMGLAVRHVTIIWRFADEDGPTHDSQRRVN